MPPALLKTRCIVLQRVTQHNCSEKISEAHSKASVKNLFWVATCKAGMLANTLSSLFTSALFAPALITPRANFKLPPIKTTFYSIQKLRNWKKNYACLFRHFLPFFNQLQLLGCFYCSFVFIPFQHNLTIRLHINFVIFFPPSDSSIFSNLNSGVIFSSFFPTKLLNFSREDLFSLKWVCFREQNTLSWGVSSPQSRIGNHLGGYY